LNLNPSVSETAVLRFMGNKRSWTQGSALHSLLSVHKT